MRVVYLPSADADLVEIVRVVHAARDMRTFAADFGEP